MPVRHLLCRPPTCGYLCAPLKAVVLKQNCGVSVGDAGRSLMISGVAADLPASVRGAGRLDQSNPASVATSVKMESCEVPGSVVQAEEHNREESGNTCNARMVGRVSYGQDSLCGQMPEV